MTVGAVASRLIVAEADPGTLLRLVALQVSVVPAVSAVIEASLQPVEEAMFDSGSPTSQLTSDVVVYQPLLPCVPLTTGAIEGGEVIGQRPPDDLKQDMRAIEEPAAVNPAGDSEVIMTGSLPSAFATTTCCTPLASGAMYTC